MSKTFNNFVAKHMHKVHKPAVEESKRNKMLDDLAEREQDTCCMFCVLDDDERKCEYCGE